MRHDDDIGVSVTPMLDDMPAEMKEKILSTWCKEIKHAETKLPRPRSRALASLTCALLRVIGSKSGAGKCLFLASRPTAPERTACSFITIHTDDDVSTKRLCDFGEDILHQHRRRIVFLERAMASQIRSLTRFAVALAILTAWTRPATADQQQRPFSFQVPKNDSAAAEALASKLAALSPTVNREEAELLAECAYATVSKLRREYRMFGTPIFNNFLIYHGLRKRGYCYQWSEDLLIALDKIKLTSLELHWGESNPGNWRENNCIVVTAKGQPFNRGVMLECWRHLGHLYFGPIASDWEPYVENSAYARFVLARSAAPNASRTNHRVAFQTGVIAKKKAGD